MGKNGVCFILKFLQVTKKKFLRGKSINFFRNSPFLKTVILYLMGGNFSLFFFAVPFCVFCVSPCVFVCVWKFQVNFSSEETKEREAIASINWAVSRLIDFSIFFFFLNGRFFVILLVQEEKGKKKTDPPLLDWIPTFFFTFYLLKEKDFFFIFQFITRFACL